MSTNNNGVSSSSSSSSRSSSGSCGTNIGGGGWTNNVPSDLLVYIISFLGLRCDASLLSAARPEYLFPTTLLHHDHKALLKPCGKGGSAVSWLRLSSIRSLMPILFVCRYWRHCIRYGSLPLYIDTIYGYESFMISIIRDEIVRLLHLFHGINALHFTLYDTQLLEPLLIHCQHLPIVTLSISDWVDEAFLIQLMKHRLPKLRHLFLSVINDTSLPIEQYLADRARVVAACDGGACDRTVITLNGGHFRICKSCHELRAIMVTPFCCHICPHCSSAQPYHDMTCAKVCDAKSNCKWETISRCMTCAPPETSCGGTCYSR
jgi:hypothetical protein